MKYQIKNVLTFILGVYKLVCLYGLFQIENNVFFFKVKKVFLLYSFHCLKTIMNQINFASYKQEFTETKSLIINILSFFNTPNLRKIFSVKNQFENN